jgi:hypothetical protein
MKDYEILKHYKEVIKAEKGAISGSFFRKLTYAAVPASLLFASIFAFTAICISYFYNSQSIKDIESAYVETNGTFAKPGNVGRYKFNGTGSLQLPDATLLPELSIIAANLSNLENGSNAYDDSSNCFNGLCEGFDYFWSYIASTTVLITALNSGTLQAPPVMSQLYPCINNRTDCFSPGDPIPNFALPRLDSDAKGASFITYNGKWFPMLLPKGMH